MTSLPRYASVVEMMVFKAGFTPVNAGRAKFNAIN